MSETCTHLNKAVETLASALPQTREWPTDLDESAPKWGELMKQLGEVARWVTQGAVVVRDDAEELPPNDGRPLASRAAKLMAALDATMSHRVEVDHAWRAVAATFTGAQVPTTGHKRPTLLAGVLHDATQAVRKAADRRLTAGEIESVLDAASVVCQEMGNLAVRISVAVEHREQDHPGLAGIPRLLRRSIHNPYRDAGEQFATAAAITEQITARWPGRWPDSV